MTGGAPRQPGRPVVIGLVGGIGSGKSTVARLLEEFGAAVSDSDGEAKNLLRDGDVRDLLAKRWGPGVLDAHGDVDRAAVARIVFGDSAERAYLESVIHPRLHARRKAALAEAAARGVRAFVIDAPLLFEAGVDRECDTVIFVDAPADQRLARVRATRGWPAEELSRREAAQLPLDEKRRRSGYTVANSGSESDLRRNVRSVLDTILAR